VTNSGEVTLKLDFSATKELQGKCNIIYAEPMEVLPGTTGHCRFGFQALTTDRFYAKICIQTTEQTLLIPVSGQSLLIVGIGMKITLTKRSKEILMTERFEMVDLLLIQLQNYDALFNPPIYKPFEFAKTRLNKLYCYSIGFYEFIRRIFEQEYVENLLPADDSSMNFQVFGRNQFKSIPGKSQKNMLLEHSEVDPNPNNKNEQNNSNRPKSDDNHPMSFLKKQGDEDYTQSSTDKRVEDQNLLGQSHTQGAGDGSDLLMLLSRQNSKVISEENSGLISEKSQPHEIISRQSQNKYLSINKTGENSDGDNNIESTENELSNSQTTAPIHERVNDDQLNEFIKTSPILPTISSNTEKESFQIPLAKQSNTGNPSAIISLQTKTDLANSSKVATLNHRYVLPSGHESIHNNWKGIEQLQKYAEMINDPFKPVDYGAVKVIVERV
jgi:hypothetical protein